MDEHPTDDQRFDASQYAFFGGDISQEVELGGLDEEDEVALSSGTFEEDERNFLPPCEKEKVEALDTLSQLDGSLEISNISSSYRNLELGSSSDPEVDHDIARRVPNFLSQSQWEEPEIGFNQIPFSVTRPHPPLPLQAAMFHNGQQQIAASQGNLLTGYRPHVPLPVRGPLQPYSHYGGSHGFLPPPPLWHLMPPSNMQQGISRGFVPGFLQQQLAQQYASLPFVPEALVQRQFGHPRIPFVNVQQASFNPMQSAHPFIPNDCFNENHDGRDLRHGLQQRNIQTMQSHQQGTHGSGNSFKRDSTQQQFRSKYMTSEEIEGIAKIQRAATQSSDPYIGDYYHQAVQAKSGTGAMNGRHHFAPYQLRDLTSHRRSSVLQPSFVPVDGLGKVPFSSVRSPRPLLEVEDFSVQSGAGSSLKLSEHPLEQEPMLAARIAIEDGLCRLLDVDDIDRYLSASQLPDSGAQLRRQRQTMLEELAASLHLLEHLDSRGNNITSPTEKNGHLMEAEAKDLVFLHIVSLPKGRKLLCRFLQLLPQGSQLVQRVCIIVFRHLHFLFGVHKKESDAATATSNLAKTVANCAAQMDLKTVSACVAAVVSSSEQPPLRPFGSASGDGASLILKSLLDRATYLLRDSTFTFSMEDRESWQEIFDIFFLVLYKYCTNTFDRILHTMAMSSSLEGALGINEAAAEKMSKEMPIELLRASLPHMNEQQRKALLDFTQRSIAMGISSGQNARGDISHANSADEAPG
eukprot:c14980_g1_i1 orf=155-2395(+)